MTAVVEAVEVALALEATALTVIAEGPADGSVVLAEC